MKKIFIVILLAVCTLASAQRIKDLYLYNNFIYNDSINNSTILKKASSLNDITKKEPVRMTTQFRIDSLSGHPKFVYRKYISVDGNSFHLWLADTITYGIDWTYNSEQLYYTGFYAFSDASFLIKRFRDVIETIDSTQAIKVELDAVWEYAK